MTIALGASALRPRVVVASIVAIAGGVTFRWLINTSELTIYIPLVAIVIGALVIHLRALGAQLLGRALFWSNFVLGSLLCFIGSGSERRSALGLLIGCGIALVLADRRALAEATDDRGVRPATFAGTIQLLMVLALADAQTCLLLGLLDNGNGRVFLVGALALVVGFIGLYRLALWGVVITMVTATALAVALLADVVRMYNAAVPLAVVFGAQIFAPMPMLYSIFTKRPLPEPSGRFRSAAASVFVIFVMIASLIVFYVRATRY